MKERWKTLDLLKAFGIIAVILVHIFFWWFDNKITFNLGVTKNLTLLYLSGLFASTIPLVAGASIRFYLRKIFDLTKLRITDKKTLFLILKRSSFLVLIGFLMNYLTWGVEDLFSWDVLQFIALSTIIITLFLTYSSLWYLLGFSIIFITLGSTLKTYLQTSFPNSYLTFMLVGENFGDHFWPLYPWFIFIIYGFLLGHFYLHYKKRNKIQKFYYYSLFTSAIFLFITLINKALPFSIDKEFVWGPSLLQPPLALLASFMGFYTLIIIAIDFLLSKKKKFKRYGFINTFSKGILWIYILTTIISYHMVQFFIRNNLTGKWYLIFVMSTTILMGYVIGSYVVYKRVKIGKEI